MFRRVFHLVLIALLFEQCSAHVHSESAKIETFSNELLAFITNYYLNETYQRFDYVILGKNCKKFAFAVVSNVHKKLQRIPVTFSITIKYLENSIVEKEIILETSTIIFIDSDKDYKDIQGKFVMKNIDNMKFQHIIIFQSTAGNQTNVGRFPMLYDSLNLYMSFIAQQKTDIENIIKMFTFDAISTPKCKLKFCAVNEFSTLKQKWTTDQFGLLNKKKQFNKCHFRIYSNRFDFAHEYSVSKTSKSSMKGQELLSSQLVRGFYEFTVNVFDILAQDLNFTYSKQTENTRFDFEINISPFSESSAVKNSHFLVYSEDEYTLVISTGEPYDALEKLILPFDPMTWLMVLITFSCAFLVILIVKFSSVNTQKFVFGSRVTSPVFNVVIVFFGQTMNILPGRNFARYHLMVFILFSLIIRTGYQGVQYEMIFKVKTSENEALKISDFFFFQSTGHSQEISRYS